MTLPSFPGVTDRTTAFPADSEHTAAAGAFRVAIVQTLEALQRDGLQNLPASVFPQTQRVSGAAKGAARPASRPPAPAAKPALASKNDPTIKPDPAAEPPAMTAQTSRTPTVPQKETMPKRTASTPGAPLIPRAEFVPLSLPVRQRIERLGALQQCVAGCTRCPELASTRQKTVFGVGNPEAKFIFLGEAPGADEDTQGVPFVGRAGQLLDGIIKACRLERSDVYICNVLRCRPPGNRLPTPVEAANCREYLDGQLAIVNPDYIICLGTTAARALVTEELPIGKLRGRFYQYGRSKVLCTYHPSYLLRNPPAKKEVWEDMKFLFRDLGIELTAKADPK